MFRELQSRGLDKAIRETWVVGMYTLTLIAQKGVTGNTTLAINPSVAAEAGWRAGLVDLDPQVSAAGLGRPSETRSAPPSRRSRPRSAVVSNQAPPREPLPDEAATVVAEQGLEVAPFGIGARVAFQHALTNGLSMIEHEPRGKAVAEITALFGWARKRLEG